jgi:hypothetical protein
MHMRTDVSTPFDDQPNLSKIYGALFLICALCDGNTILCETPFFVYRDGSLYPGKMGMMSLAAPDAHPDFHDLWDELLLISHGISTKRYDDVQLMKLEEWSRPLATRLKMLCVEQERLRLN